MMINVVKSVFCRQADLHILSDFNRTQNKLQDGEAEKLPIQARSEETTNKGNEIHLEIARQEA